MIIKRNKNYVSFSITHSTFRADSMNLSQGAVNFIFCQNGYELQEKDIHVWGLIKSGVSILISARKFPTRYKRYPFNQFIP